MAEDRETAYLIERELAARLRAASKADRLRVASEVYSDLYRRVYWHPDLTRPQSERDRGVDSLIYSYGRWMAHSDRVLEIGAGSGELLRRVAPSHGTTRFVALDITRQPLTASGAAMPPNAPFVQGTGGALPFGPASFDFVYCSQVLEHFHPDDVPEQLGEIARVLKTGGWLGLDTPNRLSGPHDISRGFTEEPSGLHLKEWTYGELADLLLASGFDRLRTRLLPGRIAQLLHLPPPGPMSGAGPKRWAERRLAPIRDVGLRRALARLLGVNGIFLYARRGVS